MYQQTNKNWFGCDVVFMFVKYALRLLSINKVCKHYGLYLFCSYTKS